MLSVLRVVVLHTCTKPPLIALPWIQWILPGMPEVFFVSGALAARALRRRPGAVVVRRRLWRILPPFWFYGVAALTVMTATALRSTAPEASLPMQELWRWVVPIARPTGSVTRTVLWGHLWFVTAFVWVLALSPLTLWIHRRSWAIGLALPLVAFAVAVYIDKLGPFRIQEEVYNVTMFGAFFQLGYFHDDERLWRLAPKVLGAMGVAFFTAGWVVATWIEQISQKELHQLYASQISHLLDGDGWLFGLFALRGPISAWLDRRPEAVILDVVNRRNLTIFLWGPAANAVALSAVKVLFGTPLRQPTHLVPYLVFSVLGVIAAVVAFGWLEDLTAGRTVTFVPWRRSRTAGAATGAPGLP